MRFSRYLVGVFALVLLMLPVGTQESKKEKLKKEIMQKVKEIIKRQNERLLKEIEKLLDKELEELFKEKPQKPAKKARGYLGVKLIELDSDEREELELDEDEGVRIAEIILDTPADKSELEVDDIIIKIDGKKVGSVKDVIKIIKEKGAGAKIRLLILRDSKRKVIKVKLAPHPEDIKKKDEDDDEDEEDDEDEDEE